MRNIHLLFTLVIALAASAAVQAQFFYYTSGTYVIITGYSGSVGNVTTPTTAFGLPITGIAQGAFRDNYFVTNVTINNGIRFIGQGAFDGCVKLVSVSIPGTVTNIGGQVFVECLSLTAITVDTQNLFYSSLDGVLFNKDQTTLVEYPGGLAGSYAVPASVTSIGDSAF